MEIRTKLNEFSCKLFDICMNFGTTRAKHCSETSLPGADSINEEKMVILSKQTNSCKNHKNEMISMHFFHISILDVFKISKQHKNNVYISFLELDDG